MSMLNEHVVMYLRHLAELQGSDYLRWCSFKEEDAQSGFRSVETFEEFLAIPQYGTPEYDDSWMDD